MLDAGYWILDAGYWMLDTGYWVLDAGRRMCERVDRLGRFKRRFL